jgi:cysteine desulfurase
MSQINSRPSKKFDTAHEVYLDNAATAPLYTSVIETVACALKNDYGNPSSQHARGRAAKAILEESRVTIAHTLGVYPDEIYFTSGGTESNNLAIMGACAAYERRHGVGTIVTTALEHPSVTKTVRGLKRSGWSVSYLDAAGGKLDLEALRRAVCKKQDICLISAMSVQNELGYRFPLNKIVDAGRASAASPVLIHTDAVQAYGKYLLDVRAMDVDLLSFCSHKIGGPKGIGALYVRRGTELFTTAFGGGQEGGLRSGTEALPLIAGFAEAARIAYVEQESAYKRVTGLKDYLLAGLRNRYETLIVNSREDGSPFIVNFTLPGIDNRKVLDSLSEKGIFLSATMACSSNHASVPAGTWRAKHPLALHLAGVPKKYIQCTYRISLSDRTTAQDISRFLQVFEEVVPLKQKQRTA